MLKKELKTRYEAELDMNLELQAEVHILRRTNQKLDAVNKRLLEPNKYLYITLGIIGVLQVATLLAEVLLP